MATLKPKAVDPAVDPLLRRFCKALDGLYGDRIERVVLFGSRARGAARRHSDYDVAVFLKDMGDRWAEIRRLAELSTDLMELTGEEVQAIPFAAGAYRERTPLMHEIRCDGVDLGPAGPPLSLHSPPRRENHSETAAMSPEADLYVARARRLLRDAQANFAMGITDQAGRIAYAAAFNAAQALIFEESGRVVKTHRGIRARFGPLTRDEPGIDARLRQFLQDGYRLKRVADYFEPGDEPVSLEQAQDAVETATRFVDAVAALLA